MKKHQNLSVPHKHCEIDMCTDGAPVNVGMYWLVKEEVGEHFMLTLCPAHKIELAISNSFKESTLNNMCSQNYVNIFYLFQQVNLWWRLFKRQAVFEGIKHLSFKRSGTRWVEHQRDGLKSHLHNLVVPIGFCNNQFGSPHNDSIKIFAPQLECIKNDGAVTLHLIFDTIKFDVLGVIETIDKVLQEANLLSLLICHCGLQQIRKLVSLIDENREEIFYCNDLSPTVADIIEHMKDKEEGIVPERHTWALAAATDGQYHLLNDQLLKGSLETALTICHKEFKAMLTRLQQVIEVWLA